MNADALNACFEFGGAIAVWLSVMEPLLLQPL